MATNRHIIAKQLFNLTLLGQMDGYALQERISRLYWDKVVPALADLFDQLADPEVLIRVDFLEIDLGEIKLDQLDNLLADRLVQAIGQQLEQLRAANSPRLDHLPISYSHFEAWIHFLEKGHLPWQSGEIPEEALHSAALKTIATEMEAVESFRKLLVNRPHALHRLVVQHPEPFLQRLTEAISGKKQSQLTNIREELQQLLFREKALPAALRNADLPAQSAEQLHRSFWTFVFQHLAVHQEREFSKKVALETLARELPQEQRPIALAQLSKLILKKKTVYPVLAGFLPWEPEVKSPEKAPGQKQESLKKPDTDKPSTDQLKQKSAAAQQDDNVQLSKPDDRAQKGKKQEPVDKIRQKESSSDEPHDTTTKPKLAPEQKQVEQASSTEQGLSLDKPQPETEQAQSPEERDKSEISSLDSGQETKKTQLSDEQDISIEKPLSDSAPVQAPEVPAVAERQPTDKAEQAELQEKSLVDLESPMPLDTRKSDLQAAKGDEPQEPTGEISQQKKSKQQTQATKTDSEKLETGAEKTELPSAETDPEKADSAKKDSSTTRSDQSASPETITDPTADRQEKPAAEDTASPPFQITTDDADIDTPSPTEPELGPKHGRKEKSSAEAEKTKTKEAGGKAKTPTTESEPEKQARDAKKKSAQQKEEIVDEAKSKTPQAKPITSDKEPKDSENARSHDDSLSQTEPKTGRQTDDLKQPTKKQQKKAQSKEKPGDFDSSAPSAEQKPEASGTETPDKTTTGQKSKKQDRDTQKKAPEKNKAAETTDKPEAAEPSAKKPEQQAEKSESKKTAPETALEIKKDIAQHRAQTPAFDEQAEGSVYYIQNAGVILVHAFLAAYFRGIGLVEGQEFVDERSRHKAVHLIEYMATGKTDLPEYGMVLPKFLCELPLEIPLEREVGITTEDLNEAEDLLRAAIKHWGALGEASPDGLREGFLQREGKLEKRANGWFLLIEHQTIDILLNRLPWSMSMIKLPWMKEMLRVEWK